MAYIVDPTDPTQPTGDKGATQGDDELRALKAYIATLAGLGVGGFGVNVFRKNLLIGGDFDTNPFQRGNSFVGVPTLTYIADKWRYNKSGTMIEDAQQGNGGPILGTVYKNKTMDSLSINSLFTNVSTAQAVLGVNDFASISQIIEGSIFRIAAQVPLVLSFWHNHKKTGVYCVALKNGGIDRSYIAEYTQVVSNAWEFESIVIPATPVAGTWGYFNTAGLEVSFCKGGGVNKQTPANVWTIGNFDCSPNQVNSLDAINNVFTISLIQLEAGTLPSKFEKRTIQEELILCQRYYEKTFSMFPVVAPAQNAGITGTLILRSAVGTALFNSLWWSFSVRKRIPPTVITYNPSAANANWRDFTAGIDRLVSVDAAEEHGVALSINAANTAGNIHRIHVSANADF